MRTVIENNEETVILDGTQAHKTILRVTSGTGLLSMGSDFAISMGLFGIRAAVIPPGTMASVRGSGMGLTVSTGVFGDEGDYDPIPVDDTPPEVTTPSLSAAYTEGSVINFDLSANEQVTWSASHSYSGSLDPATGIGSYTVPAYDAADATRAWSFYATDSWGNVTEWVVEIDIVSAQAAPEITSIEIQGGPAIEGRELTAVAKFNGTGTVSYRWWTDGPDLSTSNKFTPTGLSHGQAINVEAIATGPGGTSAPVTTSVSFIKQPPVVQGTITGNAQTVTIPLSKRVILPADPVAVAATFTMTVARLGAPIAATGLTLSIDPTGINLQFPQALVADEAFTISHAPTGTAFLADANGERLAAFAGLAGLNKTALPEILVTYDLVDTVMREGGPDGDPATDSHARARFTISRPVDPRDGTVSISTRIAIPPYSSNPMQAEDVVGGEHTVVIPFEVGGPTTKYHIFTAVDDPLVEDYEQFRVDMLNPVGLKMSGTQSRFGGIYSNDSATPTPPPPPPPPPVISNLRMEGTFAPGETITLLYDLSGTVAPEDIYIFWQKNGANERIVNPGLSGAQLFLDPAIWAEGDVVTGYVYAVDAANQEDDDYVFETLVAPAVVNTATSIAHQDATFTFAQAEPTGTYANGEPWVVGPVSITSIGPVSEQHSGTYSSGRTYTNRWVHGTEVDPGNRRHRGGTRAGNQDIAVQGMMGVPPTTNLDSPDYSHTLNQDPGALGGPLNLDRGSVFKFISRDGRNGRQRVNEQLRPGGERGSLLTVVDVAPHPRALRPGVAASDKTSYFTQDDWDISVFRNLPKVPGAESAQTILKKVQSPWPIQSTDTLNAPVLGMWNNGHSGYPREVAQNFGDIAIALHFNYTPAEKIAFLNAIWAVAIDSHERTMEGGYPGEGTGGGLRGGNGASYRHAALVLCCRALNNANTLPGAQAKLAEMKSVADYGQNPVYPEDIMVHLVTQKVVDIGGIFQQDTQPPPRPQDPYLTWFIGTNDGNADAYTIENYGSNLSLSYRDINAVNGMGAVISVMATQGGEALWNHPGFFRYYRAFRELWQTFPYPGDGTIRWGSNSGESERVNTYRAAMFEAVWPNDPAPPVPVAAYIKDDFIWVTFNKPLVELVSVPASNWTVRVNGTVVPVTIPPAPVSKPPQRQTDKTAIHGIFRENAGLKLPQKYDSKATATISYAGGSGTNKLRSAVHHVNVAAFSNLAATNLTEKIGGINPTYPVVRFDGSTPDKLSSGKDRRWGPNAPRGSLYISKLRILSRPSSNILWFGSLNGFTVHLYTDGHLRMTLRDVATNSMIARIRTGALPVSTTASPKVLDILFHWDIEDPSAGTGHDILISENGGAFASKKASPVEWRGAPGVSLNWNRDSNIGLGSGFNGEMGGLWMSTNERVTNPELFREVLPNGSLRVGTLGDGITGKRPEVFVVGNAAQYNSVAGVNRGSLPWKLYAEGPPFVAPGGTPRTGTVIEPVSGGEWI